jgi:hypothetical protein
MVASRRVIRLFNADEGRILGTTMRFACASTTKTLMIVPKFRASQVIFTQLSDIKK